MDPQQTLQALIGLSHERHSDDRPGDDQLAKRLLIILGRQPVEHLQAVLAAIPGPLDAYIKHHLTFPVINDLCAFGGKLKGHGRLPDAERIGRLLLTLAQVTADDRCVARARWALANCLAHQRKHEEAYTLLSDAAHVFEASGRNFMAAAQDGAARDDIRRAAAILATLVTSLNPLGQHHELPNVEARCRGLIALLPEQSQYGLLAALENNLSSHQRLECNYLAAEAHLLHSLRYHELSGSQDGALNTRVNLANLRSTYFRIDTLDVINKIIQDATERGNDLIVIQALPIKADLFRRRGNMTDALKCLDELIHYPEVSDGHRAIFDRVRATIYIDLNRNSEAKQLARRTSVEISKLDDRAEQIRHRHLQLSAELSLAELRPGKRSTKYLGPALTLLDQILSQLGQNFPQELKTDIDFAQIRLALLEGKSAHSHQLLDKLTQGSVRLSPLQAVLANTIKAELLLEKQPGDALRHLDNFGNLDIALAFFLGPRRAVCRSAALQALGRDQEALATCLREIDAVDERNLILSTDVLRLGYARDKTPLSQAAQRLALRYGNNSLALELDSRQHILPPKVSRQTVGGEHLREGLGERRKVLSEQLFFGSEVTSTPEGVSKRAELQAELTDLYVQMFPSRQGEAGVTPRTTPEEVTNSLKPDQAIVWFQLVDDLIYAHVLSRAAGLITSPLGPRDRVDKLHQTWHTYFRDAELRSQNLKNYGTDDLRCLYDILLQPIMGYLEGIRTLHIALPPDWDDLAVQAATSDEGRLIDRFNLSRITSLEDPLYKSHQASDLAEGVSLVIADTQSDNLPETTREARRIQTLLKPHSRLAEVLRHPGEGGDTNINPDQDAVRRNAPELVLLHVAGHGKFDADNPLFSSLLIGGKPMCALDFYHLDLRRSPLIVISACESARHGSSGGAAVGLARAMRVAGAGGIIACQWKVSDFAARKVMEHFYDLWLQGELGAAAALCQAQRELAKELPIEDWAAFIFVQG